MASFIGIVAQEIKENYIKDGKLIIPKCQIVRLISAKYGKSEVNVYRDVMKLTNTYRGKLFELDIWENLMPAPEEITETETFFIPKKYKNIFVLSDLHIPYYDDDALATVAEWMGDSSPDAILLNGDIVDFYQCSDFIRDPRKKGMEYEVECALKFFESLKKSFPDAKIFYKYGNHEYRFQRILFKNPALLGLKLADLSEVMTLKDFNITPIGYHQPIDILGITGYHGHEIRVSENVVSPARSLSLKLNKPSFIGHCHRGTSYDAVYNDETVSFYSVGCLCNKKQVYNPFGNKWSQGAMRIYDHNGHAIVENKIIKNGVLQHV